VALERVRHDAASPEHAAIVTAMLGWAAPFPDVRAFAAALRATRTRLAELRRDDAPFSLATAHATKGLEFDHVLVIGLETGRFPSARSVQQAEDPRRALEEERRLGYVAWTRARRTLTLVYDPANPSIFLREAFTDEELGLPTAAA
jgi:superfamily I DNA/RNA helicase